MAVAGKPNQEKVGSNCFLCGSKSFATSRIWKRSRYMECVCDLVYVTHYTLAYNQPGEICICGPQIMKGDIGYVDHDEEVFIVDRVKVLIKFKDFQLHLLNN